MTIQPPVLLNVERQGLTVILHLRDPDGDRQQLRCGPLEDFNPRAWSWTRNSLAGYVRGDPEGYLSFTTEAGRNYRFAVPTEDQLLHFRTVLNRPIA